MATRLELTGSVSTRNRSRLSARTSGLIRTIHVDAGDVVKQGALLMDLDPALATARQLEARTKQQRAIIEQEDYLRGLPNLKRMTSLASTGLACASVVTLTFLPALLTLILPLADRFGARRKRAEVTD